LLSDLDRRAAEEGRTRAAMAERLLAGSLGTVAKRLPRITHGRIDVAGTAAAPEPAGERRDEVVEVVKQSEVDEDHGGGSEVEEPPIRARHAKPDAVESAQEAQARKFIEQHQKKPK